MGIRSKGREQGLFRTGISRRRFLFGSGGVAVLAGLGSWGVSRQVISSNNPTAGTACCQAVRVAGVEVPPLTAVASIPDPSPAPSPAASPSAFSAAAGADGSLMGAAPAPAVSDDSAPPAVGAPAAAPAPVLSGEEQLAANVKAAYGIIVVLEGQEWGDDEANRLANIGAVVGAFEALPAGVRSAISSHPHGPLHLLSNRHGRTLMGWQPYGDFAIGFYTNSDRGTGLIAANQVVCISGFTTFSAGHELMHAYQFRNVAPGAYGTAMAGSEMKSFAESVGWQQLGSDEQVVATAAADPSWSQFNALFSYQGRPLTYINAAGAESSITAANPIEAFAIAGAFYYTRPASLALPDWPEHWAWFASHLG